MEFDIPFPDIPVRAVEHFGQCAEDVIVRAMLLAAVTRKQVDICDKIYLEIGGNHPFATSATYLLAKTLRMKGVLVEANAKLIDNLKKGRPDDTIIYGAVQEKDVAQVMFSVSKLSELSSVDRSFVLNWAEGRVGEVSWSEVPALRINDLFKMQARPQDVVYLSIDVEGMDLTLLKDLDFKTYRPWIVQAEPSDHHTPGNSEAIVDYMKSVGYQLAARTNVNLIFSDRE
jgi:FkbM family methyltransferase